jgi:hypothetical protein
MKIFCVDTSSLTALFTAAGSALGPLPHAVLALVMPGVNSDPPCEPSDWAQLPLCDLAVRTEALGQLIASWAQLQNRAICRGRKWFAAQNTCMPSLKFALLIGQCSATGCNGFNEAEYGSIGETHN